MVLRRRGRVSRPERGGVVRAGEQLVGGLGQLVVGRRVAFQIAFQIEEHRWRKEEDEDEQRLETDTDEQDLSERSAGDEIIAA